MDDSHPQPPRRAAILTVSDGVFYGTRQDASGAALAEMLTAAGFEIAETAVVADEVPDIEAALRRMAAGADLVVSTGGTGLGPRDVTPEATARVMERAAPGLAETMRAVGRETSPMAIISRGLTGVVGTSLVLNLPGSPKGATENLGVVMPVLAHALQLLAGDTQHTSAQTAIDAPPAPVASPGGGPGGAPGGSPGGKHRHEHREHEHKAPVSAPAASAPTASPGVGPSDVTLDLARHLASGSQVLLATAIRTIGEPPCQPGQKMLLGADGPLSGTLGCSEFDVSAAADAASVLAEGHPVLRTYNHDLGSVEVYLEPYLRRPQLVVLAATPVALWLLRWGRDLGYETVLIESRSGWITPEHRAAAGQVLADASALAVPAGGDGMDVVATDHDAPDVAPQVATLLAHHPRFVGIMGSARHTGHHLADLKGLGAPAAQVDAIQSPVGLNLGAKTPQEIALSVLGGLMAARTGRPGGWIDPRTPAPAPPA